MGTINTTKEKRSESEKHLNWMGGAGYFVSDPIKQLELAATSCFFGEPQYYHRGKDDEKPNAVSADRCLDKPTLEKLQRSLDAIDPQEWRGLSPADLMVSAIDKALAHDAKRTLEFAVSLRQEHYIRTTPQVILVRAANHPSVRGTGLLSTYGSHIVQRADEPAVGLAYHIAAYGKSKPIPNSLKKVWRKALESYSEYQLAKYRMSDRLVKTVDVVNLVHPKSEAVGKLVRGELRNEDTWEAIISKKGSNKEAWKEALDNMGHMALLRNIRNLLKAEVPYDLFVKTLVEGVPYGKQLPFRYLSAHKVLTDAPAPVKEALADCIELSMKALPRFPGKLMSLCDNSGSAWGATTSSMGIMHIAEIANLTAVIGAHLADEGWVGVFGDELKRISVSKRGSILEQTDKVSEIGKSVGGSTENGIWLFWDQAICKKEHWDNVFVFSDQQAGHGGLYGTNPASYKDYLWGYRNIDVGKLVKMYRARVNPNVNVFLVQVAGYRDTIMPEFYNRTYILGGWGEGLFKFAHQMSKMISAQK